MVEIKAYTRLELRRKDKRFLHSVTYYVSPLKRTTEARINSLSAQPEFGPLRKEYEKRFQFKGGKFRLQGKGRFVASFHLPENPRLGEVGFALSTPDGQHLGTLYVPIWK